MEINKQVIVVTGGGSGLGQATAEFLFSQGAKVVVWDKTIATKTKIKAFACDVTSEEDVKNTLDHTINAVGCPRILVQCAGILGAARIVGKEGPMSLTNFKTVINVNLIGTFNVMRLVAAAMMTLPIATDSEERGVIINTASIAAFEGQIGQAAYSASKGGVVAMTLPAAREFAQYAIRVNTIAPGLMETPMLLNMKEEVQESLKKACVFPARLGRSHEFASLASHIIQNSLINGEVIRLDGAIRLQAK